MQSQTNETTSERIRYTDGSGRMWYGTLTTENRNGRRFRFDLESEGEILDRDAGEATAHEIEASDWLRLRGERGRHLLFSKPLITYSQSFPGMDGHGRLPFVLRGITHNVIESRFYLDPITGLVDSILFSSDAALFVLGEQMHDCKSQTISWHPDRIFPHEIRGLGRITFRLTALVSYERHTSSIRDHCGVSIKPTEPLTLVD